MLTLGQFEAWLDRLAIPHEGRDLIRKIRQSDPQRRVAGRVSNVSGRYASRKMGFSIQFESHLVELAFIYEFEHDPDVLEYYDQPCSLDLTYTNANGRTISARHTPDFFVVRTDSAGWEECKDSHDLPKLAAKNPCRFRAEQDGTWRCPPGEACARPLNLYYRIRSSAEIDWVLQRNLRYLSDYTETAQHLVGPLSERQRKIMDTVRTEPGVRLCTLLAHSGDENAELFAMIATERLYVNLRTAPIAEPERVQVFLNKEIAIAVQRTEATPTTMPPRPTTITLRPGQQVNWDGRTWRIINVGDTVVCLMNDGRNLTEFPRSAVDRLASTGLIADVQVRGLQVDDQRLNSASEDDLKVANRRVAAVLAHLNRDITPESAAVPARTLRDWTARFKAAEQATGTGYIGLLPNTNRKGNRCPKLPADCIRLMNESINDQYLTLTRKTRFAVWAILKQRCAAAGVMAPSYATFCKAVQDRSAALVKGKRQGAKAAYSLTEFQWYLTQTTPRHGDRPFEIAHMDHTELDIELVSSQTGRPLGRPWISILTDAFSRSPLAVYLTFDAPSHRSCMMLLRDCVARHHRLPDTIVVDGGSDFRSVYFEALLAYFGCTKKVRPSAQPRFGSVVERLFGTTNTQFVHTLRGNVQARDSRHVTLSDSARSLAIWTLADLYAALCAYLFSVYGSICHPALADCPQSVLQRGAIQGGTRFQRIIAYDQNFLLLSLPGTRRGTAKVLSGRGIKVHHVLYWADCFRDPAIERTSIPVRIDPFDIGHVYALVNNRWVECQSEYYSKLRGHSEKECLLATREIVQQQTLQSRQRSVTAKALAAFFSDTEASETILIQRMREHDARFVRAAVGNSPSQEPEPPIAVSKSEYEACDLIAVDGRTFGVF